MVRFVLITAALLADLMAGALVTGQSLKPRDLYLEAASPDAASASGGHHLGVTYTVKLVDPATSRAREVDPDRAFHEGDCFAVEFTSNRDGSLYIFNHGSSGEWRLLMPSPDMPDERKTVKSGASVMVPAEYCFQLDRNAGVETLVLVIMERKDDVEQLRAIRKQAAERRTASLLASAPGAGQAEVNTTREVVESWQALGSRDIVMQKVVKPEAAGEHPYSVYVVKSVLSDMDRLVIEIKIRHE